MLSKQELMEYIDHARDRHRLDRQAPRVGQLSGACLQRSPPLPHAFEEAEHSVDQQRGRPAIVCGQTGIREQVLFARVQKQLGSGRGSNQGARRTQVAVLIRKERVRLHRVYLDGHPVRPCAAELGDGDTGME